MSFSERHGLKPKKSVLQIDSMDDDLRNSLWNALCNHYWDREWERARRYLSFRDSETFLLTQVLWRDYFKKPTDEIRENCENWDLIYKYLKAYFYAVKWNGVYDFIEFVSRNYIADYRNDPFRRECNQVMERELSAYRFAGDVITPISNEIELKAIEEAVESKFSKANHHLKAALKLFSDRQSPDYRNTIQESISAVEAVCRELTGESTLGKALNKIDINSELKAGLEKIYAYTNAKNGIRHALMNEDEPVGFEEAKFMLVACSAFVNFLAGKSSSTLAFNSHVVVSQFS